MKQPDDPGGTFSRLCLMCQQRPGHGRWVTCAPCDARMSSERDPNPWWVSFTPLRFFGWVQRRWM